ncbi:cytochrome c oxidase assembly protein [Kineococcus auxinigenes]|uniref:cytochrome c oxidase assembly protein n=1 Tax=unclassified Kineococcus TaxID=2621656 RepID=UPI003D7DE5A3
MARARRLSRWLRRPAVGVLTHPLVAGVLDIGGLWVLHATDLFHSRHTSVVVHALVHAHVFLAGYVSTSSVVGVDPGSAPLVAAVAVGRAARLRRRPLRPGRVAVRPPPQGVDVVDVRAGAQLMYYGGDLVDVVLIVPLVAGWYRATRPRAAVAHPGLSSS